MTLILDIKQRSKVNEAKDGSSVAGTGSNQSGLNRRTEATEDISQKKGRGRYDRLFDRFEMRKFLRKTFTKLLQGKGRVEQRFEGSEENKNNE